MLLIPISSTTDVTANAGISTLDIPTGSSTPDYGDLFATWTIDTTVQQYPDSLQATLAVTYTGLSLTLLTWSITIDTTHVDLTREQIALDYTQTVTISPVLPVDPGTYTVTFAATDGTLSCTATMTLTITALSGSTVPPAITNGNWCIWQWPPTVTLYQDDSATIYAKLLTTGIPALPVTLLTSGLPTWSPVIWASNPSYGSASFDLYTTVQTAPGTYTVTLIASNGALAADFTFTLVVLPGSPPTDSTTLAKGKGAYFGIVRSNSHAGPAMRALVIPVNPITHKQTRWRHTFATYKQLWLAIGPNGAANVPTGGIDPRTAWTYQATTFSAPRRAGPIVNGVQGMPIQGPLATVEAYMLMAQTTMASLGLPPLPTPLIASEYLAFPATPYSSPLGDFTLAISGPASPSPTDPGVSLTFNFTATPLPASPFALAASGTDLATQVSSVTLNYSAVLAFPTLPATATATSSSITYTIPGVDAYAPVPGNLITTDSFTPAGYNVTNAAITAVASDTVTIATTSNPGPMTAGGNATGYAIVTDWWTAQVLVAPIPTASAGSKTLNFSFSDTSGTHSGSITLAATNGGPRAAFPCPYFWPWKSVSVKASLDATFNIVGLVLATTDYGGLSYPMSSNGAGVPGLYKISSSGPYTSTKNKPPSASMTDIMWSGPNPPANTDLLTALTDTFGPLPPTGKCMFNIAYADPTTGAVGQTATYTLSWAAGTTRGFDAPTSLCPYFTVASDIVNVSIARGGNHIANITLAGYHGYFGPVALAASGQYVAARKGYLPLPTGITVTYAANPLDPNPSHLPGLNQASTAATIAVASGTPIGSYTIVLNGTDPGNTHRVTLYILVA